MNRKESDKPLIVAGIGELLWDNLPAGRQPGGAPANFACHATQLGADGCVVSAVGRDDSGRELLRCIDGMAASTCISEVDFPTGQVEVRAYRSMTL